MQSLSKEGSDGISEAMEMYEREKDARKKLQAHCHKLKQQVSAYKIKFRQLEAKYNAMQSARGNVGAKVGGAAAPRTPARGDDVSDAEISEEESEEESDDSVDAVMMR